MKIELNGLEIVALALAWTALGSAYLRRRYRIQDMLVSENEIGRRAYRWHLAFETVVVGALTIAIVLL